MQSGSSNHHLQRPNQVSRLGIKLPSLSSLTRADQQNQLANGWPKQSQLQSAFSELSANERDTAYTRKCIPTTKREVVHR